MYHINVVCNFTSKLSCSGVYVYYLVVEFSLCIISMWRVTCPLYSCVAYCIYHLCVNIFFLRVQRTFTNRCLRNILNIRWPEVVSNEQLWDKTKQTPAETEIRKRKWGWIGHTLRKPTSNITRQALDWNPQGKRKVGRPKQTWRRSTDAEIKSAGTTWAELKKTSHN